MTRGNRNKLYYGWQSILRSSTRAVVTAILAVITLLGFLLFFILPPLNGGGLRYFFSALLLWIVAVEIFVTLLCSLLCLILIFGTPYGAKEFRKNLYNAGLVNHADEPPYLVDKYPSSKKFKYEVKIHELDMCGIAKRAIIDNLDGIERSIRQSIVKITEGKRKNLCLYIVSAKYELPDILEWHDSYLNNDEGFVLALGESLIEQITLNLAKVPHAIFAGSSGSGKTIMLKIAIYQCIKKSAEVIIADMKGGADFSPAWRTRCTFITDENILLEKLDYMVGVLEHRKELFSTAACADIDKYNAKTGEGLKRIIFSCDEITEVLSKKGLSKGSAELATREAIESNLSKVARLGRAYGLHLLLSTQRPSADILDGQISNNIDFRICGRANKVLSGIVLDSTVASDLIDKDSQGRFVSNQDETTIFQGYWFNEDDIWGDEWREGGGKAVAKTSEAAALPATPPFTAADCGTSITSNLSQ